MMGIVVQCNWRVLSSEDAHGHRDGRNVRKNNLQNMAKEPEPPPKNVNVLYSSRLLLEPIFLYH